MAWEDQRRPTQMIQGLERKDGEDNTYSGYSRVSKTFLLEAT